MAKEKHYLCTDMETGEDLLVTATDPMHARRRMLNEYNMDVEVFRPLSEFEAEASGLDEY